MTDDQFLCALYGGVLGREPDALGLQHHLAWLQSHQSDPARYQRLIEYFLSSPEFRLAQQARLMPGGSNAFLPDLGGVAFGHAMSVGSFCHAAMALKKSGLRRFSGPFDWIFSSAGMAAHCINDDFATFLDARHYESVPLERRHTPEANLCEHAFYRDRFGVRFVFNHHDPAANAAHRAYLGRCVDRMRQVLRSAAWKLLVMVSPSPVSEASLKPLLDALDAATSNFVLLALQFNTAPVNVAAGGAPTLLSQVLRPQRLRHNLLKVELNVTAPSNGVEFSQPQDNRLLDRLLRSFVLQPAALQPLKAAA